MVSDMMTAEQLRGSIFQMAVEGKIVDRIEQEGTGRDLFDLIQKKKRQAIKEKKIKEVKFNTMISDDEKAFEIPNYWKWCRLGSLAIVITKGTTPKGGNVAYLEEGIGFLRAENIAGLDKLDLSNLKYVDEETNKGFLVRSIIEANDILITIAGTLGRTGLVREEDLPLNANQAVSIVRFATPNDLDLRYLIYVLNAPAVKKALSVQKKITAIPNLTLEIIANCVIPLAPLAEQKRIVAKIEELMPFVEQYAAASTKLNTLNASFPEMMKKSILQEAVKGKLVPQDPNDEPASLLLKKIAEEKKRLIKEGKIKKKKPLPEITEEEIPFDIPESWEWVKLSTIAYKIVDGTHHSPSNFENGEYMYVTAKNIKTWGVVLDNITYVSKRVHDEIYSRCNPEKGDVLLIKDGATTGVVTVNNIEEPFSMLSSVALIKLPDLIDPWYVVAVLQSDLFYKNIRAQMKGTGITRITLKQIEPLLIPIPPANEQRRIVTKLRSILPVIETIK